MSAVRISGEPDGVGEFVVKSESITGVAWVVEILSGRRVRCSCLGFQTRNTCRHVEAVRKAWNAEPRPSLEDQLERSLEAERERQASNRGEALLRR